MDRLLGTIFSMGYNWNRREFRRFRNCALAVTLLPIPMLFGAAALGEFGWRYKLVTIEFLWLFLLVITFIFAYRRAPFVVGLTTLVAATDPVTRTGQPGGGRGLIGDLRVGLGDYFQLMAVVIASQTGAAFIVLWAPFHSDPILSVLALPVTMGCIALWVWSGGEFWWRRLVWLLTITTLVFGLVGLIMPYAFPEISREIVTHSGSLDRTLVGFLRGQASAHAVFWIFVLLLLTRLVALQFVPKDHRVAAGRASFWLIAALLVSWFILGAGGGAPGGSASAPPRSPRIVATPHLGVRTIEVPLLGFDRLTPVGHLVIPDLCWAIQTGGAKITQVKYGGRPEEVYRDTHFDDERVVEGLRGEGTVMLLIYRQVRVVRGGRETLSCRPSEALSG